MCGICGIYNLNGAPIDAEILEKMRGMLVHRGPDGAGAFVKGGVGLGHRRLSIIDLEGGAQPLANESGSVQLIFNGEIYNFMELRRELESKGHIFRTRSDTEVIVHGYEEWGYDCVNRFNGIFAFALWDSEANRLFLARDHLGVKPLYYNFNGKRLIFASEIKALLAEPSCPREVDTKALGQLFTFRFVPSPLTIFKGISKLNPGHMMVAGKNGLEIKKYWDARPRIDETRSTGDLIEQYRRLLEDSIRLQLRSDVPVGLFLSSGIDSCAILAIASRFSSKPLHTFTIGFEGGEKTNETDDAKKAAAKFGARHSQMFIGPADYEKYYEKYLWDIEEPLGNETAAAFYFVSFLAKSEVKVALAGQGADEPWAGYHRHLGEKLSALYGRLPALATDGVIKRAVMMLPRSERLKRGVLALSEPDALTRLAKIYSFFSAEMKDELFNARMRDETGCGYEAKEALRGIYSEAAGLDPLARILYIDTRANLPDDLLMVADKTSMANSIEARVPFLDRRLVEFVETIPSRLKIRGLAGKYLHKKAVEKWLPKDMVYRKKKGFANPINEWLRGSMSRFVKDCLLSGGSAAGAYFNKGYIERMIRLHEEKKEDYLRHIYLLISFELWHRCFIGGYGR